MMTINKAVKYLRAFDIEVSPEALRALVEDDVLHGKGNKVELDSRFWQFLDFMTAYRGRGKRAGRGRY